MGMTVFDKQGKLLLDFYLVVPTERPGLFNVLDIHYGKCYVIIRSCNLSSIYPAFRGASKLLVVPW